MELNNIQINKFNKLCRTCLNEGHFLTSLYDENDQNVSLIKKLEICTSIQFDKNDDLPDKICPKCIDELFQSYNFAKKCSINNATLKQYLKKRKSHSVESSIENELSYTNLDTNVEVELMIDNEYEDDLLFDMFNKVIKNTGTRIIDTDLTSEITIKEEVNVIDLITDDEEEEEEEEQQNEISNIDNENINLLNTEENHIYDSLITAKQNLNENELEETKPEQNENSTEPSSCIEENESNQINDTLITAKQNSNENENIFEDTNINTIKPEQDKNYTDAPISSIEHLMITEIKTEEYNTINCNDFLIETNQMNEIHTNNETPEQPETSTSSTNCSLIIRDKKIDFNNEIILRRHLDRYLKATYQQRNARIFKCEICSKTFASYLNLNVHKIMHTGERPFKCELCPKTFKYSCNLVVHKRVHTGIRPYKCEICEKAYSRSNQLKVHRRTHTGERPYKCLKCPATFMQSSSLNVHRKRHTDRPPFKCDICSKTFIQSNQFNIHKRKHTGESPYKCDMCEQIFHRPYHLKIHKRVHTS